MWLTLFCYWLIALPLGIVLSRVAGFGAQGFWFGLVVGLGLAAFLLLWRLKVRQQQLYAVEQKR
jgi:MATE family multidrug resistance protein